MKEKKKHFRQWLEEDDDQEEIDLFEKSEEEWSFLHMLEIKR